jgi:hypothetical protein
MIDDEPFTLTNEPPPPRRFQNNAARRQTALFAGMDCLEGQEDLFETDGTDDDDDGPIPVVEFTDEMRDFIVESYLLHHPCRSLDYLCQWGGYSGDGTFYMGRPEGLEVRCVDCKRVDAEMTWSEFKRRAARLAEKTLF